jgi:hypothetical protein
VAHLPQTPLTPEEEELERMKARLADLEAQLADRELELASCLADLLQFEKCYLHTVGRRYALLDDLKAQIAEARARRNPDKHEARNEARQARTQAQESARAAGEENAGAPSPDDTASWTSSVLMSVWRTCWQQGRSALDFLSQLLRGTPVALALPP